MAGTTNWQSAMATTVQDVPAWIRRLLYAVGLAGVVVVIVASLDGGKEQTIEIDKVLHFTGYSTLAAIFVLCLSPRWYLPMLVGLALMGVAIEFIQPLNGRSYDMADAAANITGLAVGSFVALFLRNWIGLARRQQQDRDLAGKMKRFERGSTILREGDPAEVFYVIKNGRVGISKSTEQGSRDLGTLESGDLLGIIGAIQSGKHVATAVAKTHTTAYAMNLDDLAKGSQREDSSLMWVVSVLAKYVQELAEEVGHDGIRATNGPPEKD